MTVTDRNASHGRKLPPPPTADELFDALKSDYDRTTPDAHVIAGQIVYGKRKKGQPSPKQADLARAITSIAYDHTTGAAGAPTLTLTLLDPTWHLLTTFFPVDDKGVLLDVDVNYPENSRWWWRLHQVSPQADQTMQLVFVPRVVAELMGHFGPIKVNRAKRTRAEFLKSLVVKATSDGEFYSRELDNKQKIGGGASPTSSDTKSSAKSPPKKAAKAVGLGANAHSLTNHGSRLSAHQASVCNAILQAGDQLNAPTDAMIGAIYAAMGESDLQTSAQSVFETTGDPSLYNGGSDVAAAAKGFYQGTGSFASPGAIALANAGAPPWVIANQTEANAAWGTAKWPATSGDSYGHQWNQSDPAAGKAEAIREATAIVQGGGGGTSGGGSGGSRTVTIVEPYYFQINRGEDYWTGMNRLAQEVAWELIADGNRIYYDADTVLIRQKVAGVVYREAATTLAWNYDWENRHIATNFQLQLACDLFEFSAGEVLQVHGFGPASQGSTMNLPGRWLISEIQHNGGDLMSTFSLVQPTPPKNEPAPQTTTKTIGGSASAATGGSIAVGGFAHPFPNGWQPGRLDMGYDGTFTHQIVAPFEGTILYATRSFSNWGGYMNLQAPKSVGLPTRTLYFAEGLFPTVHAGQHVKAGQQIALAGTIGAQAGVPGNIEWGVADEGSGLGECEPYGTQLGGSTSASAASRAMVLNFSKWVQSKLNVAGPATTGDAGHF
jgi:biotin carboxyl carrier protein